jgi:hypothetical protein
MSSQKKKKTRRYKSTTGKRRFNGKTFYYEGTYSDAGLKTRIKQLRKHTEGYGLNYRSMNVGTKRNPTRKLYIDWEWKEQFWQK